MDTVDTVDTVDTIILTFTDIRSMDTITGMVMDTVREYNAWDNIERVKSAFNVNEFFAKLFSLSSI